jgi:hypothetical protein
MFEEDVFGGDMYSEQPPPQTPYSGAFNALTSEADTYVGRLQIDDIIGLGQPGDAVDCEAEYSGDGGVPLSSYYGGSGGVYGDTMGAAPQGNNALNSPESNPLENEGLRQDMQDLMLQRAQERSSATQRFQDRVAQMNKSNIGGSGY